MPHGIFRWVLPLDVVDNSASLLRTHFRLGFSSVDAPERVLHPVRQCSCPCFPLPLTACCSFTRRRLTSFMLSWGRMAPAIRDGTALPAPSIGGWFSRLPWLEYAGG